jgi:hypothetical protein
MILAIHATPVEHVDRDGVGDAVVGMAFEPTGAATFVGAATGASILFVALMLSVLYNARQKRLRDDRLRAQEASALATGLKSELTRISKTLRESILYLRDKPSGEQGYVVPDLRRSVRMFPQTLDKLGLLDSDTLQAVFGAYTIIDEFRSHITAIVGADVASELENKGAVAALPSSVTPQVITASDRVIKIIDVALGYLDKYEVQLAWKLAR